jgi:hypothetical protein
VLHSISARGRKRPFRWRWIERVPSLIRFILVLGVLAGLGWAAMYALATFVEPQPREMTQTVPPNRLTGK